MEYPYKPRIGSNKNLFDGNSATDDGGAVFIDDGSSPQFEWTDFIGNSTSSGDGGAIYVSNGGSSTFTLCEMKENEASTGYGGAVYSTTNIYLYNNLIVSNTANQDGGGIYFSSGSAIIYIINNTICENVANDGGGIFSPTTISTNLSTKNNIIYNNTPNSVNSHISDLLDDPDNRFTYSCIESNVLPSTPQPGYNYVFDADPDFGTGTGYRVKASTSPCIDCWR